MTSREILNAVTDVSDSCLMDMMKTVKRRTDALYVVLGGELDHKTLTSMIVTKLAVDMVGVAYNQEMIATDRKPSFTINTMQDRLDFMSTQDFYERTKTTIEKLVKEGKTGAIRTEY